MTKASILFKGNYESINIVEIIACFLFALLINYTID